MGNIETYNIADIDLQEIVKFAQEHPNHQFYTEPMNDGDDFLSVCFYKSFDSNEASSRIWEFDMMKG